MSSNLRQGGGQCGSDFERKVKSFLFGQDAPPGVSTLTNMRVLRIIRITRLVRLTRIARITRDLSVLCMGFISN